MSDPTKCLHCDGWGCRRCLVVGGEQSPSIEELCEERLRSRVRELEAELQLMRGERDRFAHETTDLRRKVDGLKQQLSAVTRGAKR